MNARRFLFDTDFRPRPDNPVHAQEAAAQAEAVARAEAEAYARGLRDGQALAEQQVQARLSDAVTRLGLAAAGLIGQSDARDAAREDEAMDFAIALARKIAGEALDAHPLAAIGDAARAALQHLARERGFEGRLVVLGEPDLAPGDARMEWADGGVVRDRARIEGAVLSALGIVA